MSKTFYSAPIIAMLYFSNNFANSGIQMLKKIIINGDNPEDGRLRAVTCNSGKDGNSSIPQSALPEEEKLLVEELEPGLCSHID